MNMLLLLHYESVALVTLSCNLQW